MNVIYEPKGRAREYSPLACNLYMGCTHGCKYCYAPACMHKKPEEWHEAARARGDNVLKLFEKDCAWLAKDRVDVHDIKLSIRHEKAKRSEKDQEYCRSCRAVGRAREP